MNIIEHQAPNYDGIPTDAPIMFTAGPIQGAPHWQKQVIEIAKDIPADIDTLHIANPRRETIRVMGDFSDDDYNTQVDWEEVHILRSYKIGGILYWFAAQDPNEPYEPGRAYAQTTKIELGDTIGMIRAGQKINVVVGFDPEYKGGSKKYIAKRAEEFDIPVYSDLYVATTSLIKVIESQQ